MGLLLRKYLWVLFFTLCYHPIQLLSQGQCLGGGCTGGSQYPSTTLSSNTNSWTTVSTVTWAGEYGVYNVTSGSTYEWSLLAADGGSCSYDATLTLLNSTGTTILCFSDDYSGNLPKIQWTATFTGTVRVLLNQFGCVTNTTATTVVWHCSSCGSGSAPANDNCSGATTLTPGASCTPTAGNVTGATQSISALTCSGFTGDANDDVWYKFTATATLHTITVVGSANFDAVVDVRSGACNGATFNCADATGSGGTEIINLTGLTVSSVYYVRVYDYGSGAPATSTFTICVTTPSSCTPYYSTGTSSGDYINRVQLGTINNTPGGTGSTVGASYNDYYSTVSTSLQAGTNQNLTVTVGTYGGQTVAAWIDYNNDGDFLDAGENLGEVANITANAAGIINFTIPAGTAAGFKRMRVRDVWSNTTLDPCSTYSYGEAEDYKIDVTAACTTPGTPATLSTSGITISQAQINWTAGSPAGSATVTYYWAIGAASNVTYETNYLFRGTTTSLNAIQATLSPGTTYYWTVKAVTSCNATVSSYAAAISFVTSCTTPSVPTVLNTTNVSTTSATLNFTASTGSPTISYYWAVGAASNVTYEANYLQRGISSTNSVNVFGLNSNTTYYWTVKAVTSCNGTASGYPAAISFATTTVPTPLITWNGNTSTDWNTTTNWTPNQLPTITDNVVIPAGRPNYPNITTEGLSVNNATSAKKCLSLHIDAGATVTVDAALLGVYVSGVVNVSGVLNHQAGGNSFLFQINSGGVVTVKNGGILNVGSSAIAAGVPAGTVNEFNDIKITDGTLNIDPGAKVFSMDDLQITGTAGVKGKLIMTGGDLYIKYYGNGSANSLGFDLYTNSNVNISSGNVYLCGQDNGATAKMADWNAASIVSVTGGTFNLLNEQSSGILNYTGYCNFGGKTLNNIVVNRNGATSYIATNNLTLNNDFTITAGTFDNNTLNMTIAGNWTNSGTFQNVGIGVVTFTGASKSIAGTTGTIFPDLTFNNASSYTINPTAAITSVNGVFINNGTLTLSAGKILDLNGNTANNILNGTINATNYDGTNDLEFVLGAGTCNFSGTGTINADVIMYSGAGTGATLTSDFAVNGNFTIRSTGIFTMSSHTLTVNGNWSNSGTFTRGTGTVQLTGSSKTIDGSVISEFNNLTIKNGASYTLNPTTDRMKVDATYTGEAGSSLTIASGKILDLYGSTIVFNGTTVSPGANNTSIPGSSNGREIDINNTASLSGSGTTQGDMRVWGGTTTLISDFILNGNFEIRNAAGPTFTMTTHTFTVGGSWTTGGSTGGVFYSGTGTVKFTGSAPSIIDANCYYNGTNKATADFYNVVVDRSADSVAIKNTPMKILHDFTLVNGLFSTGWHTQSNGNVGNNRRLTVEGFATVNAGTTFFVGYRKACSNSDEGLGNTCACCNADSLNVPVFKGDFFNYGNVRTNRPVVSAYMDIKLAGARISGTGVANEFGVDFQVETAMSATQVGPVDIQGDLIVQDNTSFINTNPNNVLTVRGNFYMYYNLTHNGTVNCYRDFTSGSTGLFTPNTVSINNSIFNFYQTGALRHIFLKATSANPMYNFGEINIIAGAGVRELRQRISVAGNLTIQSGTLDAINSGTTSAGGSISPAVGVNNASIVLLGSTSSWTNNGTFIPHSDTVSFTSSGAQTMGGTSATTFYNLLTNKGAGSEVTFANVGTVTNQLYLTNGYVVTNPAKLLIMADQSTVTPTGGQAASFVRGPVKKIGRDGTAGPYSFIFPVGKNTIWARLYSLHWSGTTAVTDAFTCEYFNAGYGNYAMNAPLNHVSTIEWWDLAKNSGDATLNKKVRLYSEDKSRSGITAFNNADLTVAHWNGTAWDDIDNPGTNNNSGNTSPAGWITSSANSSFSPFTFASRSAANPLPIELLYFTAIPNGKQVDLAWATASELNNDYFNVERSVDLNTFETIATVKGAGNSNQTLRYSSIDKDPITGLSYYRLKQVDFDGNFTYSQIVPITIQNFVSADPEKEGITQLVVYPNPTAGIINVSFDNLKEEKYQLAILDMLGNQLRSVKKTLNEGNVLLQFDLQDLPTGVYVLVLQTATKRYSQKLIVQH